MTSDAPVFRYRPRTVPVTVERRLHRFAARVRDAEGRVRLAHVPNPGRMAELLVPGATGWMAPSGSPARVTDGTLVSLRHGSTLVSIDTQLPNRLVGHRLRVPGSATGWGLPEGPWRSEIVHGGSRLDFGIPGPSDARPRALLEVKSANLRVGRSALFPDAPTVRGARHLRELTEATRHGVPTAVLFVVQRGDVVEVGPNRPMDPEFAEAFDEAARAGVRFAAVRLRVAPTSARLGDPLPVVNRPRQVF